MIEFLPVTLTGWINDADEITRTRVVIEVTACSACGATVVDEEQHRKDHQTRVTH